MSQHQVIRLTDYQVACEFGDTLSLIYKDKIAELDEKLQPVYNFLETLDYPRFTDLDRWFARQCLTAEEKRDMAAIEHMKKIRGMAKKMRSQPDEERLNVEKARAVPITAIYDFKKRGTNVSCPFHADKHPSASIKYNRLVCFQCGAKYDGIALFMKLNGASFKDAVTSLSA